MNKLLKILGIWAIILLFLGCAGSRPYTLGSVKTFDPDTSAIPEPDEKEQYQYWDRIDNTTFHQLEKPLDLNRTFRFAGRMLGVAGDRQADNVNHLDQVPESSWYSYRHYHNPMTPKELARGPNTVQPDTAGEWTIFRGKLEGANSGFFIEDANGNRFLIKFDGYKYPELTTAAEVISTKIFYGAGYYVPESTITYFDPENVRIGEGVKVSVDGEMRPMTWQDYLDIIKKRPRNKDGKIRVLASKFVDGRPVGPWGFEGTRNDDPNDRVLHEHRRELRGMRVISSWLNDTDRRDANTMSVYTSESYIKHLVQDFGNTLGANGTSIHTPIYGQAYLIDPRYMALSAVALGGYVRPWEQVEPEVRYPAVGYFKAEPFQPGHWVPVHPLPAFENMTLRDAFWGAKIVMSFSNEDIRAMVETGQISSPKAEEYLVQILIDRRDNIGRYWFRRINPVAKFHARIDNQKLVLQFDDLGVTGNVFSSSSSHYRYNVLHANKVLQKGERVNDSAIEIPLQMVPEKNRKAPLVVQIQITTNRPGSDIIAKETRVFVALEDEGPRIVGVEREE